MKTLPEWTAGMGVSEAELAAQAIFHAFIISSLSSVFG
jgi:hypothetical protein